MAGRFPYSFMVVSMEPVPIRLEVKFHRMLQRVRRAHRKDAWGRPIKIEVPLSADDHYISDDLLI